MVLSTKIIVRAIIEDSRLDCKATTNKFRRLKRSNFLLLNQIPRSGATLMFFSKEQLGSLGQNWINMRRISEQAIDDEFFLAVLIAQMK